MHFTFLEMFVPQLTFIIDEKPDKLPLYISPNVKTLFIDQLKDISKNVYTIATPKENALVVGDAYTLHSTSPKSTLFLSIVPNNSVFLVLVTDILQTKQITDDGYSIGYRTDAVGKLLKTVFTSLKNQRTYNFVRIDDDIVTRRTFDKNKINAVALFGTNNNVDNVDKTLKIDVVDYGDLIDVQQLAISLPFARREVLDFALIYTQLQGKRAKLKTVVAFDTIIVGDAKIQNRNVNGDLKAIVESFGKPEFINFYNMFFDVYNVSRQYAHTKDVFAQQRSTLQVLEQFSNDVLSITKKTNLDGFYDQTKKTLIIKGGSIDGIDITRGMKVTLIAQQRQEEDGVYLVTSANKYTESVLKKEETNEEKVQDLKPYSYVCYGDQSIKSKELCESQVDGLGERKTKTYWDRPCVQNNECPFYQANKNYRNYRGGCIDGRCEMPIGIQAVSYRLYDKTSQASCHNCLDVTDTKCCDEQKDKSKYPTLTGPDYAFELDQFERLQ